MHTNLAHQLANTATAGSAVLAGTATFSWITEAEPYITAGPGIAAIIAGLAAAWYKYERARLTRAQRRKMEDKEE